MKAITYINILSLDVMLGAMICSVFLGQTWVIIPAWESILLLGCVVWLIYTFDHLKDVYKTDAIPATSRHAFHARHFKSLIVASLIIVVMALLLLMRVNDVILRSGIVLMALVCMYFLLLHFLPVHGRYPKEIVIAILYTSGIALPLLSMEDQSMTLLRGQHLLQLFAIALGNLLCFSMHEFHTDRQAGFPSLMQVIPARSHKILLAAFLLLQIVASGILYSMQQSATIQIVFAIMAGVLLLLTLYSHKFRNTDYFRLIGDSVFILPVFFIEFGRI